MTPHGHRERAERRSSRSRGQTLVEFALVLPVFVLMLFGIIDAGRFVYMTSVLSQGAREGARVAAVEASWVGSSDASCNTSGGPACPPVVLPASPGNPSLKTDIVNAANRMVTPFGSLSAVYFNCAAPGSAPSGSWTGTSCGTNASSNIVSVRVVMTFTPLTPVIGQILGSITTSGSATMVIN